MVTVAPETTEFEGSVILPSIEPVVSCAVAVEVNTPTKAKIRNRFVQNSLETYSFLLFLNVIYPFVILKIHCSNVFAFLLN